MSKEHLEALEHVYYGSQGYGETDKYYKFLKEYLESIDNANTSEALEILDDFKNGLVNKEIGMVMFQQYWFFTQIEKVKQALLKAQEQEKELDDRLLFKDGSVMCGFDYKGKQVVAMPSKEYGSLLEQAMAQESKQYLKWEDLEFKIFDQEISVLLNGNKYSLKYYTYDIGDMAYLYKENRNIFVFDGRCSEDKRFFNDLHLERVEE